MHFEMTFLWLGLIQVFGYFVEGCAGFGCAVIAAPFVTSMLDPKIGTAYATTLVVPFLTIQTIRARKEISWKDYGKIMASLIPGLLVGQYIFKTINPTLARVGIGGAVTLIALMKVYAVIIKPLVLHKETEEGDKNSPIKKALRIVCLILGGMVQGAFNIGGPLITVYTLESVKDKKLFRNTMLAVFMTTDIMNAIMQYRAGYWTLDLFSAVTVGWPFAALGFFTGVAFLDKMNKEQFLRFVYVVLLAVGLNMFIRNIIAL